MTEDPKNVPDVRLRFPSTRRGHVQGLKGYVESDSHDCPTDMVFSKRKGKCVNPKTEEV